MKNSEVKGPGKVVVVSEGDFNGIFKHLLMIGRLFLI